MASAETGTAAEVKIRIAASPETVFDFFTDPDKMIQWMGRSAELDPRAGGTLRCDINGRDIARGEYVAVERPDRIVFTWGWEGDEERQSLFTITLNDLGGKTELTLRQEGLGTVENRDAHGTGWNSALNKLVGHLAAGDPSHG